MRIPFLLVVLLGLVSSAASALAQDPATQTDESGVKNGQPAPVAFVYVARPTHLDAFTTAADGTLTPAPGSPYANLRLTALVASQKYLVALQAGGQSLQSFAIANNGSVKSVSTLTIGKYLPCRPSFVDPSSLTKNTTGSDVYLVASDCKSNDHLLSFRIESNGDLQFLGASNYVYSDNDTALSAPAFLINDVFAYQIGCDYPTFDNATPQLTAYKRSSSGLLEFVGSSDSPIPTPPSTPGGLYCPITSAGGPSNRLAMALANVDDTGNYIGHTVLAVYSADSHGNLTTVSTPANMPVAPDSWITQALSISPSGKYLALAGDGVQIYRFNGSSPITHFAIAHLGDLFDEIAWDGANHVYAHDPQNGDVRVFTITSSGIKEAPGSPYVIPESVAMTVVSH